MNDFPWAEQSKNLSFNNSEWNLFSVPFKLNSASIENKFCAEYSNIPMENPEKSDWNLRIFLWEYQKILAGICCGHGEDLGLGRHCGQRGSTKGPSFSTRAVGSGCVSHG